MKYPEHLHSLHNEYPIAPENVKVGKVEKLIPNLNDKTNYMVHHETLKFYLDHGLELIRIHRGIAFEEPDWMKPHIDLNTSLRAKATNDFEKDNFKPMNNAVFEKTMENVRNRVDVKLVTNEKQARKLICKPNFQHHNIFCEHLAAIHLKRTHVLLDKPIIIGQAILDLSKILMYKFHYDYVKQMYGVKAKLLFTDSLMYGIPVTSRRTIHQALRLTLTRKS